jgi:hypothetical protein
MTGWILTIAGGVGVVWGAVCVLTGASETRVTLSNDVSLSALTVGLISLAVGTIGLLWVRD